MTSLKETDLFLMQRDDLVLSFNGGDFKELVIDANQIENDNINDRIDNLDDKVTDLGEDVTLNTNKIDVLVGAVDIIQKTSTRAQLSAHLTLDGFNDGVQSVGPGHFYMTEDNGSINVYEFEDAKKLYISSTTHTWGDPDATADIINSWEQLAIKGDPDDQELGDVIQIFNADQTGYGVYTILGRTNIETLGQIVGYIFDVEFIRGDGGSVTPYTPQNPELAHIVAMGIQTNVGLNIDDADDRYLVKALGGEVLDDTTFRKQLITGRDVISTKHTVNAYIEDGSLPVFTVRCEASDNTVVRKFQVRNNGELLCGPDFKPTDNRHIATVKYVRDQYLTEDGAEDKTISANSIYARLDGANKMTNSLKFAGVDADNNIIKVDAIPTNEAIIQPGENNLHIRIKDDMQFSIGRADANKFRWQDGKGKVGDTHANYVKNNYQNDSNDNFLSTVGMVKKALEDYPDPGKSSLSKYGLVKMSDSISSNVTDNAIVPSQRAIYNVNIKIYRGMPVVKESSSANSQAVGGFRYYNGNLFYRVS